MLRAIWQDIRYSVRLLIKQPAMTLTAVGVLTLGIGVNAGIFGLINGIMIRPLPGQSADSQVVGLFSHDRTTKYGYRSFSYPDFKDLQAAGGPIDTLAAHNMAMVGVHENGATRQGFADIASANYFDTMGVQPIRGRFFSADEERPGSHSRVTVVGYTYWERTGFADDILRRSIRVNGQDYGVIGVGPKGFGGTTALIGAEFWLPLGVHDEVENEFNSQEHKLMADRQNYTLILVARLKAGITQDQADQQLKAIAAANEQAFPVENKNRDLLIRPLSRMGISTAPQSTADIWAPLSILQALAAAVLLIACLNLANMMLAAGVARQKEIAIRLAVGGSRVAVVRQLLIQGLLLSLAGGAAGLVVASWAMKGLVFSMQTVLPLAITFDNTPDLTVIGATLLFCALATIGFGLLPALRLSKTDVAPVLKDQAGEIGGRIGKRLTVRGTLITVQLALSLALLILSGLFVRAAGAGASSDPGFNPAPVVVAEIDPRLGGYDEARAKELRRAALERLRATPGIEAAGMSSIIPFGNISITAGVQREGPRLGSEDEAAKGKLFNAEQYVITSDHFRALGLSMMRGREFTMAEELGPTGTHPVIIDMALAEKLFPNEDPIGQILQLGKGEEAADYPMEIVGIAPALRHEITDRNAARHVYLPSGSARSSWLFLYARAANGNAYSIVDTVRDQMTAVDANAPIISIKPFVSWLDASVGVWFLRAGARLFLTLGLAAALVAVVGLYGVKSYVTSRRTREFGVRMAIGASPREILRMVMREAAATTSVGLAVGLAAGAAMGFGISKFLYLVRPFDAVSLIGASVVLATASMLATFVPAMRASKVSPMAALRDA